MEVAVVSFLNILPCEAHGGRCMPGKRVVNQTASRRGQVRSLAGTTQNHLLCCVFFSGLFSVYL